MPSKHKTRLWTHGVSVLAQEPEKFKIERFSWGARVSPIQVPSTNKSVTGWFHFAIPTPTKMDSNDIRTNDIFLSLVRNGYVLIKQVLATPVNTGTNIQAEIEKRYFFSDRIEEANPEDMTMNRNYVPANNGGADDADYWWDIRDDIIKGPICISVELGFYIPNTYVIFRGAGAQFAEENTY